MRRTLAPIVAAALGLAGSLAATLALHRAAAGALDRVQEERLRGAGETTAELLGASAVTPARLRAIMVTNGLDGAYLVSPELELLADATGPAGGRVDLLRVDAARARAAMGGRTTVARAYDVGSLAVLTGYFPVRAPDGAVAAVLALEAGRTFAAARARLEHALALGVALACAGAAALFVVAVRWERAERRGREAATRAARGEAAVRTAAAVAREMRDPLGTIRRLAERVRDRAGSRLPPRDRARLDEAVHQVERLRVLADELLDLSGGRPLQPAMVDLAEVAAEAARGNRSVHPGLDVSIGVPALPVLADPALLRRVFASLLANAAEAGARRVEIRGGSRGDAVGVLVADDGPGISARMRDHLFEPFASGRPGGIGLGLAVSRRILERHGGTLALAGEGSGAVFELRLPRGT